MNDSSADRLVAAVRTALSEGGDPDRAVQQQRYMKSALPFHGIALPELRRALRPVLAAHALSTRTDLEAAVRTLWDGASHREEWYAAIAVLRRREHRRWLDPDALPLLGHLVVTGAWWDVVDEIAQHVVGTVLAGHRAAVAPVMISWAVDADLWIRRTALLSQNRHPDADLDLLGQVLDSNLVDSLHGREFFIRKAVGWALRERARHSPAWVLDFVDSRGERLSPLSRKEALRHLA